MQSVRSNLLDGDSVKCNQIIATVHQLFNLIATYLSDLTRRCLTKRRMLPPIELGTNWMLVSDFFSRKMSWIWHIWGRTNVCLVAPNLNQTFTKIYYELSEFNEIFKHYLITNMRTINDQVKSLKSPFQCDWDGDWYIRRIIFLLKIFKCN